MSILDYPFDIPPFRCKFGLVPNTWSHESIFDRSSQAMEMSGAIWMAELIFKNLDVSDARRLAAFKASLHGQAGRFRMYDFSLPEPQGNGLQLATAQPTIHAVVSPVEVEVSGWEPGAVAGVFKAGDYFEVGGELKMIMTDSDIDENGRVRHRFEPFLRVDPTFGAPVNYDKPKAVFRLIDDKQNIWDTRPPLVSSTTLKAVEAV